MLRSGPRGIETAPASSLGHMTPAKGTDILPNLSATPSQSGAGTYLTFRLWLSHSDEAR